MEKINVIEILNEISNLKIKCPSCDKSFSPKDGRLFDIRNPYPKYFKSILSNAEKQSSRQLTSVQKEISKAKDKIIILSQKKVKLQSKKINRPKEIKIITEKINIGQIIERFYPLQTNSNTKQKIAARSLLL